MNTIPDYIFIIFISTACLSFLLLLRSFQFHKQVFTILFALFITQGVVAFDNFYLDNNTSPPHFVFLYIPSLLLIISIFTIPAFRTLLSFIDYKYLLLIHVLRIPVEFVLWKLAQENVIPISMTFEGTNFDIISGISAIAIYYWVYVKKQESKTLQLAWNVVGIILLLNIFISGILSIPSTIQQINFDHPNLAILYFPFVWLPSFILPAVLFAHLASIRNLMLQRN